MKRILVKLRFGPDDEHEVGALAEVERGRVFFEYAAGVREAKIEEISRGHQRVALMSPSSKRRR